jgi:hypothetical protein
VTEKGPRGGARDPHARGFRGLQVLLAILTASEVVGASLLVVSLPPSLALQEAFPIGAVRANFPTTTSTEHPAFGNFTTTTFVNQTSGPSSRLTMTVRAVGFAVGYNGAIQHVRFFYDVTVHGTFARNIHPQALLFNGNLTGSAINIDFRNNWDQGPNVSSNRQQVFGFWDNGTGALTATLTNGGGPGPLYEFEYGAHGESFLMNYKYTQFVGFRATVTGWMLPPIRVGVLMEISNVPKTVPLFPRGTSWTVYGYNETRFDAGTSAPFAVTGAFNASSGVTAYILNLSERWSWINGGVRQPTAFHWRSAVGTRAASIDVILPPGDVWYLEFVDPTPFPPGPVSPITVAVNQEIVATT